MRKTSAAKAAQQRKILERRRELVLLLRAGLTQQEAAEMLRVSEATISADVAALSTQVRAETGAEFAALLRSELQSLDGDEALLRAESRDKDGALRLQVMDRVLAVQQHRAHLAGLDQVAARPAAGAQTLDDLLRALDAEAASG